MKKNRIIITSIVSVIGMSVKQHVFAAYTLLENVPWTASASFPEYITGLYNFLVAAVAVCALLMITIGGIMYILSAGNQSTAGTAKTVVKDAITGLIIVFITWLILNTINPDLLNAKPDLSKLQQGASGSK